MTKIREESGQSTIEFALTLILIMTFLLGFTQLSLLFGFGNYAHYATFMAARAQLSAGQNQDQQTTRARDVIVKMLKRSEGQPGIDRWPSIAKADGGGGDLRGADLLNGPQHQEGNPSFSWMQGVRYAFRGRLFMIPLGGDSSTNSLTLMSESWLGVEPSYEECIQRLPGTAVIDNGC